MEIQLTNNWKDITVEEFIELLEVENTASSFYSLQLNRLCILSGTDFDDDIWDELDIEEISVYINKLDFINIKPTKNYKHIIGNYKLKNLNKLTLGEYIDLDAYIQDMYNNFTKILSIVYRRYKNDEWGNEILEPYSFDINIRKEFFNDVSITDVYGIFDLVTNWRENLLDKYKALFNVDDGDELNEDEKEGLTENDIREIEADLKKEKEKAKFAWPSFVYSLSGEDLTKVKEILDLPITYIFNNSMMIQVMK